MTSHYVTMAVLGLAALAFAQECGKVAREPTRLTSKGLIDAGGISHNRAHQGIINGQQAQYGSIPWQVKLFHKNSGGYGQFCGGSLLNQNWIVTAQHCVIYGASEIGVQLGGYKQKEMSGGNSITCGVSKIVKHPNYGQGGFIANDVALFRLTACNKPVRFSQTIRPICLPSPNTNFRNPNTYALTSGWGRIIGGATDQRTADVLQQTVLRFEDFNTCKRLFGSHISSGNVCASGKKGDRIVITCQGDSGGPLAVRSTRGIWELAGVVSFGPDGCKVKGLPAVFAHVPNYVNWIKNVIRS